MSQAETQAETSSAASTTSPEDDWSSIRDPSERRKIQNRIAQRKFREKVRLQREESEREAENQRQAGGTYTTPEPDDMDTGEVSGLPWGGISFRHVVASGKAKEKENSSRATSLYAAASRTGGSSRLGLHLLDQYARGSPAWTAWRYRMDPGQASGAPQSWPSTAAS